MRWVMAVDMNEKVKTKNDSVASESIYHLDG